MYEFNAKCILISSFIIVLFFYLRFTVKAIVVTTQRIENICFFWYIRCDLCAVCKKNTNKKPKHKNQKPKTTTTKLKKKPHTYTQTQSKQINSTS